MKEGKTFHKEPVLHKEQGNKDEVRKEEKKKEVCLAQHCCCAWCLVPGAWCTRTNGLVIVSALLNIQRRQGESHGGRKPSLLIIR